MKIEIPFSSWDGKNDFSGTLHQAELESYFGPTAIAFDRYQNATQAVLEVLGSRTHTIPVILPITTSPEVLSGVLRSGANPILLDIDETTLQIDPTLLKEVLDEIETAVVVLSRPCGQPVDPRLLELTNDLPTVLDSRLTPTNLEKNCIATFNLFDLTDVIGTGAILIHKYKEQIQEIKYIRNGVLGLGANLNQALALCALKRLKESQEQTQVVENFKSLFKNKSVFTDSTEWPYFMVRVSNASKAVAHLHSYGIATVKPIFPLHLLSEVNRRWQEKPSYPVAEKLTNSILALPVHKGIVGKEKLLHDKIMEVDHG